MRDSSGNAGTINQGEITNLAWSACMIEINQLQDFTLLLFLHFGRVDGSLHPNEKDVILEKMAEIFPGESFWEERLIEMDKEYNLLGIANSEDLLRSHLPKFGSAPATTKNSIHVALYDIINANGRVSEEETTALHVFKDWLTS
jgi:hypothetical protein